MPACFILSKSSLACSLVKLAGSKGVQSSTVASGAAERLRFHTSQDPFLPCAAHPCCHTIIVSPMPSQLVFSSSRRRQFRCPNEAARVHHRDRRYGLDPLRWPVTAAAQTPPSCLCGRWAACLTAAQGSSSQSKGLHELGYIEGKNLSLEWHSAEGKYERSANSLRPSLM